MYEKLAVAIIGWIIGFYQSSRNTRRSEIARLKDRLVDKIEKIQTWYIEEIAKEGFSDEKLVSLEETLSTKLAQIELRIRQLNNYAGCELLNQNALICLRLMDTEKLYKEGLLEKESFYRFSDVIESVESNYDVHYVTKSFLYRVWKAHRYEFFGAAIGLIVIMLLFKVLEFILSNQ